jgi:hypothetical protein
MFLSSSLGENLKVPHDEVGFTDGRLPRTERHMLPAAEGAGTGIQTARFGGKLDGDGLIANREHGHGETIVFENVAGVDPQRSLNGLKVFRVFTIDDDLPPSVHASRHSFATLCRGRRKGDGREVRESLTKSAFP